MFFFFFRLRFIRFGVFFIRVEGKIRFVLSISTSLHLNGRWKRDEKEKSQLEKLNRTFRVRLLGLLDVSCLMSLRLNEFVFYRRGA